jgi:hypothetical protein
MPLRYPGPMWLLFLLVVSPLLGLAMLLIFAIVAVLHWRRRARLQILANYQPDALRRRPGETDFELRARARAWFATVHWGSREEWIYLCRNKLAIAPDD